MSDQNTRNVKLVGPGNVPLSVNDEGRLEVVGVSGVTEKVEIVGDVTLSEVPLTVAIPDKVNVDIENEPEIKGIKQTVKVEVVNEPATQDVQGPLSLEEKITAEVKPVLIGGVVKGTTDIELIEVDENGQQMVAPLNTRVPWSGTITGSTTTALKLTQTAPTGYRNIITWIWAANFTTETNASAINQVLELLDNGNEVFRRALVLPASTAPYSKREEIKEAGNPLYIAKAPGTTLELKIVGATGVTRDIGFAGYCVRS